MEANQIKKLLQESTEFSDAKIEQQKQNIKTVTSPLITSILFLVEHLFHGVIISFVVGLIVQKKKEIVLN